MALPKKARILSTALLLTVAIGSVFYLNRSESSASTQSTDDAYVHADFTTVAPQVSGTVETVLVEDNQPVRKGDLLAVIDDRDFVANVNVAKAQVASAQAGVAGLEAHLIQQQTVIRQAQAAVAADAAALKLAKVNHARYRNLAADGSGTVQAQQQAEAQLSVQQAGLEKARRVCRRPDNRWTSSRPTWNKPGSLAHAHATQAIAELKLSYTRITAPISGTIGEKSVRVGAFVNAGKPLLAIVPLDAVYITANFRETQLARVQTGQAVDIEVDALPGETLTGTVQSLGPASGVSYSAIAPHNATGNFTKIVQRLPVRIRIEPDQPATAKLRVGMSVTPHIRIRG
ncbi:HlyD family secretion protein [Pseudomonas corrugata]